MKKKLETNNEIEEEPWLASTPLAGFLLSAFSLDGEFVFRTGLSLARNHA